MTLSRFAFISLFGVRIVGRLEHCSSMEIR